MKPKEILVFGATGQIGRNLIRKLTKSKYKVTAVTRNIHQKGYILKTQGNPGYLDVVEQNIFDEENLNELIKDKDVCINLIGILFEKGKINTFRNIHEVFPSFLASLCQENNIEKFIHISSLGIEQATDSKYANSKLNGEKFIKEKFNNYIILLITIIICSCAIHKENSRLFKFTYEIEIESTNEKKLEVWLPIPTTNEVQIITRLDIKTNGLNYSIEEEKVHNNKYLYINHESGITSPTKVSLSFNVSRLEHQNINYKNVNPEQYLNSYNTVPVGGVFEFNTKNPHAAINPIWDRWAIFLWKVNKKFREDFENQIPEEKVLKLTLSDGTKLYRQVE